MKYDFENFNKRFNSGSGKWNEAKSFGVKESDDIDTQLDCILENEIASLYVPAEKTRGTIMTIKHKDNKIKKFRL